MLGGLLFKRAFAWPKLFAKPRLFSTAPIATTTAATTTTTPRSVGYFFGMTSGLVFTMVVVGGTTRLTQSGLSMVEWKFTGESFPRTPSQWQSMFDKYKEYPEYKKKNYDMTVDQFKSIFVWEYGHRMLGRIIGVAYAVPLVYFAARGYLTGTVRTRAIALLGLGGAQGLFGWYMVQSGLDEKTIVGDVPTVSPYRLAGHLLLAFGIYGLSLWTSMDILRAGPAVSPSAAVGKLRRMSTAGVGMVIATIISGAFVAGLDAGYIYNEFPLMGGRVVPEDYLAKSPAYINMTENPAAAQFNHRILALLTLGHLFGVYGVFRRTAKTVGLPGPAQRAFTLFALAAVAQVALGIAALLTHVPVPIGVAHQSGSMVVLSMGLYALHTIRILVK